MTLNNIIENLQQVLQEYQRILNQPEIREQTIQLYLAEHILLIDPCAKYVHSQVQLEKLYKRPTRS
jgi:hypothetical protein